MYGTYSLSVHKESFCYVICFVQMWKFPFAQVIFDTDPASMNRSGKEQVDEMSRAMIR